MKIRFPKLFTRHVPAAGSATEMDQSGTAAQLDGSPNHGSTKAPRRSKSGTWAASCGLLAAAALTMALTMPDQSHSLGLAADASPHKPGMSASPMTLPASTMRVSDSSTPHPCAGRALLYHEHVDAGYVTHDASGALAVMTVDGTEVRNNDEICVRLAPDGYNGTEVSRLVVPDDPKLSFLGAPGSIVWRAPFENYGFAWVPVWAGLGAFDPEHEFVVPDNFSSNSVELTLVDLEGPGEMNIYNYLPGWDRANRILSSVDMTTTVLGVGGHGHMNWTFSKPGIYTLTWQARGRLLDGTVEVSEPVTQIWLVGTDADVDLPAGTTTGLNSYGHSAEDIRTSMGLSAPEESDPPTQPAPSTTLLAADDEAIASDIGFYYDDWQGPPVAGGTIWQDVKLDTEGAKPSLSIAHSIDDHTVLVGESGAVSGADAAALNFGDYIVIEVPDKQSVCLAAGDPHLEPIAQMAGSRMAWMTADVTDPFSTGAGVGFNFSGIDPAVLGPHGFVYQPSISGPASAVTSVGMMHDGDFAPISTKGRALSKDLQFLPGETAVSPRFLFSEPGIYQDSGTMYVYSKQGNTYDWLTVTFVVGDTAINAWRERSGKPRLEESEAAPNCDTAPIIYGADPFNFPRVPEFTPSETEEPSDEVTTSEEDPSTEAPNESETTEPTPTDEPTRTTEPTILTSTSQPSETTSPGIVAPPVHDIHKGHSDLRVFIGEDAAGNPQLSTRLRDDSTNPSTILQCGATAFRIRQQAALQREVPPAIRKMLEGMPEFPEGAPVYALPMTQVQQLPWPGVSTEDIKGEQLAPGTGVEWAIAGSSVPAGGRMVVAQAPNGSFEAILDTGDTDMAVNLPTGTHAHFAYIFSVPGTYDVTYEFVATLADGSQQVVRHLVSYVVGDETDQPLASFGPATCGADGLGHAPFDGRNVTDETTDVTHVTTVTKLPPTQPGDNAGSSNRFDWSDDKHWVGDVANEVKGINGALNGFSRQIGALTRQVNQLFDDHQAASTPVPRREASHPAGTQPAAGNAGAATNAGGAVAVARPQAIASVPRSYSAAPVARSVAAARPAAGQAAANPTTTSATSKAPVAPLGNSLIPSESGPANALADASPAAYGMPMATAVNERNLMLRGALLGIGGLALAMALVLTGHTIGSRRR